MDSVAQPLKPSWAQFLAAMLVFAGCELAMAACWYELGRVLRNQPNGFLVAAPVFLLMSSVPAIFANLQYQATFRHDQGSASAITGFLTTVAVLSCVAFLDLSAMIAGISDFESVWYGFAIIFVLVWFTAVMNWRWSSRLQRAGSTKQTRPGQWSIATMLALMTLLAVQFAIAAHFLRLTPR